MIKVEFSRFAMIKHSIEPQIAGDHRADVIPGEERLCMTP